MNGQSFLHGLDPRTKLAVQVAFVAAAYAHTRPSPLLLLTVATLGVLWLADLRARSLIVEFRYLVVFLAIAPILAGLQIHAPWFDRVAARNSALAAYRVLLLVAVGLAFVRTTTPREARGAITWLIPGRPGRSLGMGVGLVFRFLPLLRTEVRRTRNALRVRLASRRPPRERVQLLGIVVLARLLRRADRISIALRARCLAWNPTDPRLVFRRADVPALAIAAALLGWAVV